MAEQRMPRCLGSFEVDDPQCDGNPVGKTEEERAPCAYRDRCSGFIKLMEETQRPRDYFVRSLSVRTDDGDVLYTFANREDFDAELNRQIARWGIVSGQVMNKKPATFKRPRPPKGIAIVRPKVTKAQVRPGGKARAKMLDGMREKSQEVTQWLIKRTAKRLARKVAAYPEAARPGDLYLVDRLQSSNYCALYCKNRGGRPTGICSMLYRPSSGQIEVRLAMAFDDYCAVISKAEAARLQPLDYSGKDGIFNIRIRGVDAEAASLISETLQKASKAGKLVLPEARE